MSKSTNSDDLDTLDRLAMCRKSMSMAIALLSGKTVDCDINREEALAALRAALEMTPDKAAQKILSMELACFAAHDYLEQCSCCRKGGCNANCRCSNTGNLKKHLRGAGV